MSPRLQISEENVRGFVESNTASGGPILYDQTMPEWLEVDRLMTLQAAWILLFGQDRGIGSNVVSKT
ncbi:hypothetical protein FOXB_12379 [Fusarium oxysporum f. sp. conglutinans Fo5176]|uniref:Uncharacterized protein n=1 Tax=Fusarium oxysporum (strain Fo5176) TaxID=660025 RepID=F9G147_FUSOF|nr:hypothetical protein FOXB_12379 [Fusarium oxysporum f. sp. conglutinans Fo5176]